LSFELGIWNFFSLALRLALVKPLAALSAILSANSQI